MARILVVDDDHIIRTVARRLLEQAGHEVREAVDGEAALRLFAQAPADLVLTDIYMPNRDGLEVMRNVRREWPDTVVLAMSGGCHAGPLDLHEHARLLGARATLLKPFPAEVLCEAVRAALEGVGPAPTTCITFPHGFGRRRTDSRSPGSVLGCSQDFTTGHR